jgi:hypothetical protein
MEDFDLIKSLDDLLNPTDPPKEAALKYTTKVPELTSLESLLLRQLSDVRGRDLPRKPQGRSLSEISRRL